MNHFQSQYPDPIDGIDLLPEDDLPANRRIYCNRDLRLDLVEVIGFDMDYTLALYRQEALDQVTIEATVEKLIRHGYPEALRHMPLELRFPIRGLLIDKKLGHIIKADRYGYAKKAFHGTQLLSSEERRAAYTNNRIRAGTERFHSIDTLYAFCEVTLYAAAIDLLDSRGGHVNYDRLFQDVRSCIDEAHRDGSIKDRIIADPPRFLRRDNDLGPTLHRLRNAGKRLFLLTNSDGAYTEVVMRYLLGDDPETSRWEEFFEVIITDARKPAFFTGQQGFCRYGVPYQIVDSLEPRVIYEGGSLAEFERLLDIRGDRILYVGDHIFGDVLRAKKVSAWRTLMVIQELTDELAAYRRFAGEIRKMHGLEQRRYELLDSLRDRQARVRSLREKSSGVENEDLELVARLARREEQVSAIRLELAGIENELRDLELRVDRAYHPFWGSPFKAERRLIH